MRINNNLMAMNTHRQLGLNSNAGAKSIEKLSSGLRINRAGDDAAGLAISEKMRSQIRGLGQASRNSQDGISLIQTAEGALNESHAILQRVRELAVQSANGTNSDTDRAAIQNEVNQLTSEVNRIGNTTEFNKLELLNGGGADPTSSGTSGANKLELPASLDGGESDTAGVDLANAVFTMNAVTLATHDGNIMEMTIGDRTLNITYDSTADFSNIDGDTITLKVTEGESATDVAIDLSTQLTTLINSDDNLRGNYAASDDGAGEVTITAVTAAYDVASGTLSGTIDNGTVNVQDTAGGGALSTGVVLQAADGARASATIDFSELTSEDLIGNGIKIGAVEVDFYDSSQGVYDGDAAYSVDLNGARNPEQIIDAVVDVMKTADATTATSVWVSKADENTLQMTAAATGTAGNDITLGNNANVEVTKVYDNAALTGEGVDSAKGLADGEHKVTINDVAATITEGNFIAGTGAAVDATTIGAITIDADSELESGTYRIVSDGVTADDLIIEKLGDDGVTWGAVANDAAGDYSTEQDVAAGGAFDLTFGDIKITLDVTTADFNADKSDWVEFSIVENHYEATLTEANGVAGTAVTITNGEQNVTLKAEDGLGEVVVDTGGFDASALAAGDSITWSFETEQGSGDTDVVGGSFSTDFQIGANNGQSFRVDITDMRSQALTISSSKAGDHGSVEGAKYVAVADTTNGVGTDMSEFSLDISSSTEAAAAAIDVIDLAIGKVSNERAKLGAYQNRLEHTIKNLDTSAENLQAAESRIRDVDMAKEMMNFTKNNILQQAAQSMLAQANQAPQGVLQLLR